jgi:hypothetical protein
MTIPRDALERVFARAAQLQAGDAEPAEGISEARLLEIAREVGIAPEHLRQALAEERLRAGRDADADRGALLSALGPATATAQRTVPGTPAEVLAKLDAWMPRMEALAPLRRLADRSAWEPRRDFAANLVAGLGLGGRRLDLVRADAVHATVVPVDAARTAVRLDVALHRARRGQRALFLVLGVGLNLLAFMALTVPLLVLAVAAPSPGVAGPAVTGAIGVLGAAQAALGLFTWRAVKRGYQRLVQRAQLRLEQLLDELERGGMQPPGGLLGQVRDVLLKAPAPFTLTPPVESGQRGAGSPAGEVPPGR